MKTVVVTGGNGHLGYNLVRMLARRGYRVRATVRDLNDPERTRHLRIRGVRLFEVDVTKPETLSRELFEGADCVFHTAAPNLTWSKNPNDEMVRPIVEGTRNVLNAMVVSGRSPDARNKEAGCGKFIFTSSCSAIGMDAPEGGMLTEAQWNEAPVTPFIRAKIDAERAAWDFADAFGIKMISICPPAMVGPGFHRHTPGTRMYELALEGKLPPLPQAGFHVVDVRDVAMAHILAHESPRASGRYIVAERYFESETFMRFLKKVDPQLKVSERVAPNWVLPLVCAADWTAHMITGRDRQVTRQMISEFVGRRQRVSSERARRELGWRSRSAEHTVRDTLDWIRSGRHKEKHERI